MIGQGEFDNDAYAGLKWAILFKKKDDEIERLTVEADRIKTCVRLRKAQEDFAMSHTESETLKRVRALETRIEHLESRLMILEHILRYAIPWNSWPDDITWPEGQPPRLSSEHAPEIRHD